MAKTGEAGWRRVAAGILGAAAGMVGYGVLVGTRRIQVTEHAVPLPGLPAALEGLRVVQVSDLHFGRQAGADFARRVVALANGCRPDMVVLTGDFVSYHALEALAAAALELAGVRAQLGVFACLGNHDHWEDHHAPGAPRIRAALEDAGVRVLVNAALPLAEGLWLAAVDDLMAGAPDLEAAAREVPAGAPAVLLSHNPTVLPQVAGRPWLVLAGHTHGGQVALPFLGPRGTAALLGMRSFMRWYEGLGLRVHWGRREAVAAYRYPAGWYAEGRARMYVNRGAGHVWPIRLNCPPEVACFVLTAGCPTAGWLPAARCPSLRRRRTWRSR